MAQYALEMIPTFYCDICKTRIYYSRDNRFGEFYHVFCPNTACSIFAKKLAVPVTRYVVNAVEEESK